MSHGEEAAHPHASRHRHMIGRYRAVLLVLTATFALYSLLVYRGSSGDPHTVADADVRAGIRMWQERNCASCHQLYGLGGYMGPDLTNAYSVKGEEHIRTFIRYGTGRMPAQAMSDADLKGLVAFLAWVDRSGQGRVPAEALHWTGTYTIAPR